MFSIELNGGLRVVDNLDIYNTVGFSVAHEENIPIKIKDGNLITSQGSVQVDDGEKLQINFLKVCLFSEISSLIRDFIASNFISCFLDSL